ncbi:MAG: Gfo/Idh/MocA family protein [Myxococcota bacterium]
MTEPIRIALAGYGYIADYHARAAQRCEHTELAAVMGRDEVRMAEFSEKYGIGRVHMSGAELAADPEVDAVVIGLPNSLHAPLAEELMAAGKHVLVEKPMAMNAEEARRMAEIARRYDRRLMVGHMWRFDREVTYLKEALDRGDIGRVVKTKGYGIHALWGPSGWFTDPALAGGGALVDMGVHAIETVRWLLGEPRAESVYARISTEFGDYDVDDLGVIMINWEGGATSLIESGWWNPWMDGPEASTQLFGTQGYARLFPTTLVEVREGRPEPANPEFPRREEHCDQHVYDGQMVEFAASILEGRDPAPGPDHGVAVMEICDAAYLSAKEDRVVHL